MANVYYHLNTSYVDIKQQIIRLCDLKNRI